MSLQNIRMIIFLTSFFIFPYWAFGQNAVRFQKIIEPVQFAGKPNLKSKDFLQSKFFPNNNGLIEFFEVPSFSAPYGFSLTNTTEEHYFLEIKQISNWQEIKDKLDAEYPPVVIPKALSQTERDKMIRAKAMNMKRKRQKEKEVLSEYKIETININVSKLFATKLYNTFVHLIGNYKANDDTIITLPDGSKLIEELVVSDGSQKTLRCIVDNEIWSFFIGESLDEMGVLTEICNKIIEDTLNGSRLDEDKYIQLLDKLVEDE